MASNAPSGPIELGAKMDYAEHDATYSRFIMLAKYGSVFCVALLASMAFGFFTSAGFFSAAILMVLICAIGFYVLR